ncbi:hypothetical protein [Halorubrum aidingense]|uniref:hypothetical protein n=1 Tax=Halorubrum aidingense TaxID=368623 RepID=UPI001266EAAF|nr:hypothetical protein [Halorubrum aidingense]
MSTDSQSDSSRSSSDSGEDSDSAEEFDIITHTHLESKLQNQSDHQIGGDSQEVLEEKLERLCEEIWSNATDIADRDDRSRVQPRDVDNAYQQLLKPHNMIHQTISKVDKIKWELEDVADQSPFSSEDD